MSFFDLDIETGTLENIEGKSYLVLKKYCWSTKTHFISGFIGIPFFEGSLNIHSDLKFVVKKVEEKTDGKT